MESQSQLNKVKVAEVLSDIHKLKEMLESLRVIKSNFGNVCKLASDSCFDREIHYAEECLTQLRDKLARLRGE